MSRSTAPLKALMRSGRFSVIVARGPSTSNRIVSNSGIAHPLDSAAIIRKGALRRAR